MTSQTHCKHLRGFIYTETSATKRDKYPMWFLSPRRKVSLKVSGRPHALEVPSSDVLQIRNRHANS